MPAGCGIGADLVDPEGKRLAQQLMIVARTTPTITNCEDGLIADRLTQSPDDVQLGHPGRHDINRMAGARDGDVVDAGRADDLASEIPKPAHGHDAGGLKRDLEGAIFLARAFGEFWMTAQGVGDRPKGGTDALGSIRNAVVVERCDLRAVVVANENETPECGRQAFLKVVSNRFASTGCDPDASARFGEACEFRDHFRVRGLGPAPGVDHRAIVVENDSGEAGVAQAGEEIPERIAPALKLAQGGEAIRGGARFPGDRSGLPRREAR